MVYDKHRTKNLLLHLVLLITAVGCGYKLAGYEKGEIKNAKVIAVSIVATTSTIPKLEWYVTDEIKTVLMRNFGYVIVPEQEADFVLNIKITKLSTEPSGYTTKKYKVYSGESTYAVLSSNRLVMYLKAELVKTISKETIWSEKSIIEKELYNVDSDPFVTENNLRSAISKIAERLANMVYTAALNKF